MIDEENSAIRARVASILHMHVTAKALSDDAVREIIRWANCASSPQPIDTAPVDDRWYLVQEKLRDNELRHSPWIIATRGDGSWHDDQGYTIDAIAWTALPDPQPKPTGWRKAAGTIFVCNGWLGDDRQPVWVIGVTLPDGKNDDDREWDMRSTKKEALAAAVLLSARLALPWSEMPYVEDSSNVVPFAPRGALQ